MIGGQAGAMGAKGRHQTTLGSTEDSWKRGGLSWAWKSKENQQVGRGAACEVPKVKKERFLLEWSIRMATFIWHCVPNSEPNLGRVLSPVNPFTLPAHF